MTIDDNALFGLTTDHLTKLDDGHRLHHQVLEPLTAMQQAAKAQGFELQIASSFRDFGRQKAIWNAKFSGTRPILDSNSEPVDINELDDWQICQAILLYSALPGASRHHWGTDLDFYDPSALPKGYQLQLIITEYEDQGPCAPLTRWLTNHAADFGFYFPYRQYLGGIACEPWHLSYQPLAESLQQQLHLERLASLLSRTEIAGKAAILANLEQIFEQYILNINPMPKRKSL